jgi:D-hexose-6-phosphate mutarotase
MAQHTAVEWLINKIIAKQNGKGDSISMDEIFKQAKEMEKQQMIDFAFDTYYFISGIMKVPFHQVSENKIHAETNYTETYGNNTKNK